jgi:BirA family biotin operon repressor/biotin-[acetyl-CoA-carboxylase] ligase
MNLIPDGLTLICLKDVDSTNNYIANLQNQSKIQHGTVVLAENQLLGKGQRGSAWTSEPGKNMTASLYIEHIDLAIKQQFKISAIMALSLCEYLNSEKIDAKIKWPNDILVNQHKICGILIENQLKNKTIHSSIIGVGLNVNQAHFGEYFATSMYNETGINYDIKWVCLQLFHTFLAHYEKMIQWEFSFIMEHYYASLYAFNEFVSVQITQTGKTEMLKIVDIDETGLLLAENQEGLRRSYDLKEIKFVLQNEF